jgi:hypothetical protein
MDVVIAHYIRFKTKAGIYLPERAYQNYFVEQTRSYGGNSYSFAPYVVVGTSSSRGGDVPQGSIVTVPNEITLNITAEAILGSWLVEIATVLLSRTSGTVFTEANTICNELWACTSGGKKDQSATITLSSSLDAARQQFPKRVLSSYLVGATPVTGNVING